MEEPAKSRRKWLSVQVGTLSNSPLGKILLPAIGMFVFYVIHDALQEKMFRYDGFEFGWFMTLAEVSFMIVGAIVSEGVGLRGLPPGGTQTLSKTALIGLCISGSHGFANSALGYSPFPLKVAFRSCKLIPTMALGVFVTGRRYFWVEYVAAFVMCTGLFTLTIADMNFSWTVSGGGDAAVSTHSPIKGPIMFTISTCFDSIVPNLQESLLQKIKVPTADMVFLSNLATLVILLCYTSYSGELHDGLTFCRDNTNVFTVLAFQAASAYLGLRCYLAMIRAHGGVAGVLLANARKVITMILSFILFSKPFNVKHAFGIFLIFLGVYLGVVAKKRSKVIFAQSVSPPKKQKEYSHEHAV